MKKAAFLKPRPSGMFVLALTALTLTLLVASASAAATAATATAGTVHHEIPSLKGVWKGMNYTLSDLKGFKEWEKTIHITEQKDRRFRGHFDYSEGRKNFFGIVFNDNRTMLWVSSTSKGLSPGRLLDEDTMDVCYVESGKEATVGCTLFKRQKK